jgi:hypothetical protein
MMDTPARLATSDRVTVAFFISVPCLAIFGNDTYFLLTVQEIYACWRIRRRSLPLGLRLG